MRNKAERKIVFTGGGTAGHVFPAFPVRKILEADGSVQVHWIGSRRGMERQLVEAAGIPYHPVPAGKLRRYFSLANFVDLFRVAAAVIRSFFLLLKLKPVVLFSKGGYVSVPPVLAARLLRIPVVTHESDTSPGLATRINMRSAARVCIAYDACRRYYPESRQSQLAVTGNPIRRAFLASDAAEKGRTLFPLNPEKPLLVIFGGSLGAEQINALVEENLPALLKTADIIHQTGRENTAEAEEGYFPAPFFREEFPQVLAAADLVISRAGAGSLSEIAALGKPSILIPLGTAGSRGDQIENARLFREKEAALVMEGEEAEPSAFLQAVLDLLGDEARLARMGAAAAELGRPDAAESVAKVIRDVMKGEQ